MQAWGTTWHKHLKFVVWMPDLIVLRNRFLHGPARPNSRCPMPFKPSATQWDCLSFGRAFGSDVERSNGLSSSRNRCCFISSTVASRLFFSAYTRATAIPNDPNTMVVTLAYVPQIKRVTGIPMQNPSANPVNATSVLLLFIMEDKLLFSILPRPPGSIEVSAAVSVLVLRPKWLSISKNRMCAEN